MHFLQEKHYPTVIKEIHPYRFVKDREIMTRIMQTICEAIEDTHGRLSPTVYEFKTYEKSKARVLQLVNCDKHLDEKMGSSFVHVIDHKAIQCAIDGDLSALGASGTAKRASADATAVAAGAAAAKTAGGALAPTSLAAIRIEELASAKAAEASMATAAESLQAPKKVRRQSLDSISSMSDVSVKSLDSVRSTGTKRRHVSGKVIDLSSTSRSPSPSARASVEVVGKKQIMPTPKQLAQQSSEIAKERYSWEKYR